ncbi:bifunctional metallophosphatase/5'-nucleotidase [Candidatus Xianfuyuplasma coldseepsis]|uniref:Bifunctional metallophosphatase/5'-nucleotidase n=1 Tax=Candidatus Xianfuyuplasma coldseepsis TaxID=2782163 RepID=A0A7L7KQX5_9MOLU|nr:bifunctional UDP-sugar hydrolase/5'-nucleotidase [Xianfuyuplasma coldseepsis]QMS84208.1 bifunctional metallophosphatase/5'-nucleotidase [Xianfuyuplasma coldseepsis]
MKTVDFQVLHTSDIHGYVYPYHYATMEAANIGLAKLSTLIKQRAKHNHLLIDTGDTIQGSPLTYYYARQCDKTVHPMTTVMNALGYDYVAIGNHEFNYGLDNLHSYLDHLDATILNANLLDDLTTNPFVGVSHAITSFDNGPTVGIIGVTTHYIPNWEQPSHIAHLHFQDAFETTKRLVGELRNHVDYLIVNYHGGFERDLTTFELSTDDTGENQGAKMLQEIDGIDLLLTGHQHRLLTGSHKNTFYSQPGFNAQHLVEINIRATYDNGWTFHHEATIHDTKGIAADNHILNLLHDVESNTQAYLDTTVGYLDQPYLITDQLQARLHKHPLVSFINQVQLEYTNADISSCSLGNSVSGFNQHITIRDIISTYIFPNTLVVKECTGKELRKALEKTATFFDIDGDDIIISSEYNDPKLQLYAYDMYDPIHYTINVSKPHGSRVENLTFHNQPINDTDVFSIVMNNYRASGGGEYTFIKDCPVLNDTQMEVIEILIDYIQEHPQLSINHTKNITVTK